jgi:hypothetical protein
LERPGTLRVREVCDTDRWCPLRCWAAASLGGNDRRMFVLTPQRRLISFVTGFSSLSFRSIASETVDVRPLVGMQVVVLGLSHIEALLINVLLSLFGVLSSVDQPFVRWLSDRTSQ